MSEDPLWLQYRSNFILLTGDSKTDGVVRNALVGDRMLGHHTGE